MKKLVVLCVLFFSVSFCCVQAQTVRTGISGKSALIVKENSATGFVVKTMDFQSIVVYLLHLFCFSKLRNYLYKYNNSLICLIKRQALAEISEISEQKKKYSQIIPITFVNTLYN